MISGENLFSNLLTVFVLFVLLLIIYSKMSGKTLVDMVRDIRDMFRDKSDDVAEYIPQGFENIR